MTDTKKLTVDQRVKLLEEEVLAVMTESYLTVSNISKMTGIGTKSIKYVINRLISKNLIESNVDKTKYVYRLKQEIVRAPIREIEEYVPPKEPYRRDVPVIQPRTRVLMISKAQKLYYNA